MEIVINARFLTQRLTGVQRFAFELSIRLKAIMGDRIVFVSPKKIVQKEMAKQLGVYCIGKTSGYLWEQIELPFWLYRNGSPKLINFCSVAPLAYKNSYTAIHDITFIRYPETFNWKFRMIYSFMIPRLCAISKKIITVSRFSKDEISTYYDIPRDKFFVIYNAVGPLFRKIVDNELKSQRYFLAVSSVKANKNFISVLKAFEHVLQNVENINLFIIGDCEDKNFKQIDVDLFVRNPHVRFVGRVSDTDLVRYYSNAIAFVFSSYYEGFGIPVIEAQACGCPVLSSNKSSLPEVLNESAMFFDPDDILKLSEFMISLTENDFLRQKLMQKGYENVKRFSWDGSAYKLAKLINN